MHTNTRMRRPSCFPGAWSSWHLQVASLHLIVWPPIFCSVLLFLVSECSGRNRTPREAPCRLTSRCMFPERARLVHAWHLRAPTRTPPPSITCRREPFIVRACVRVPRARHRGQAQRHRGCQRALTGRGGIGRSAVEVFVATRRVCIETRRKHDWVLSGLLMSG